MKRLAWVSSGLILGIVGTYLVMSALMIRQVSRIKTLEEEIGERVEATQEQSIVSELNNRGVESWPAPEVEEIEVAR